MSHGPSAPARGHDPHAHHEPYAPVFTPGSQRKAELDDIISRYPEKRAALLPALWMVQQERGWISEDAMREVGDQLGCTAAYVKGVVTSGAGSAGQDLPTPPTMSPVASSRPMSGTLSPRD